MVLLNQNEQDDLIVIQELNKQTEFDSNRNVNASLKPKNSVRNAQNAGFLESPRGSIMLSVKNTKPSRNRAHNSVADSSIFNRECNSINKSSSRKQSPDEIALEKLTKKTNKF